MPRELINPSALHPAPGFSHITIATGTRTIYFAGQVAIDQEFNLIGKDDLRACGPWPRCATSKRQWARSASPGMTSCGGRSTR